MFGRKLTKWMPFGNFNFDGVDFIVFVRGNKKNGMLYFKVKSVNARKFINANLVHSILPITLIDVKSQWEKIIQELNK